MRLNVQAPVNSPRSLFNKQVLLFVSLLLVIVLVLCVVFIFNGLSSAEEDFSSEVMLRAAIDDAVGPTIITLDKDITLADQLVIRDGKNITLTSKDSSNFSKLLFLSCPRAVTVDRGGVLILDGVVITRESGSIGSGVTVSLGGTFIMIDGEISGHTGFATGGGVYNSGMFTMLGGVISGNTAGLRGGGVTNVGTFMMSGGVIANNVAVECGGGVDNYGDMSSAFEMSGGVIANNKAPKGGGLYHYSWGSFSLSGEGVISNNVADVGGGIYIDTTFTSNFGMFGGMISGNTAKNQGGGLYIRKGNFWLTGGELSDNIAGADGGGLYFVNGVFRLDGGKISNNTAGTDGGGVWIATKNFGKLYISNGIVFENNRASNAYTIRPEHTALYHRQIGNKVIWSSPFTQGYNNYDISYTRGTKVS
jgi:hypothetical protein